MSGASARARGARAARRMRQAWTIVADRSYGLVTAGEDATPRYTSFRVNVLLYILRPAGSTAAESVVIMRRDGQFRRLGI
jgi:hypothetical protein